jgi:sugar lactone lactonase YvrE
MTVAGNGILGVYGDGGPAVAANLARPYGVALDSTGNLLIVDTGSNRVRQVDAATGIIHTVVGSGYPGYSGDGGPATSARLMAPTGMAIDGTGNYYIADFFNHRVRRVAAATGSISTMVGVGTQGLSGDDGPAGAAQLIGPYGTAVDSAGNVYIADTFNNRVRKIEAFSGIIRTVAGTGAIEYSGDNGPARSAGLSMPEAVVLDRSGNLFVCDTGNHRVRRIDTATGVITTVAGNGDRGYSGDSGPATSARLNVPSGLAFDTAGNLLIADADNHRIRRLDLAGGVITTVAGNGSGGFSGDNVPAASASLREPAGIAVDSVGNLYIADTGNQRIRKVAATTGLITTVAGSGQAGFSGDGGPAASATLQGPRGVAVDTRGSLFIADTLNARIRMIAAGSGMITTVGGPGRWGSYGDNGPATAAFLVIPTGLTVDAAGNIFIADTGNYRIRAIRGPLP